VWALSALVVAACGGARPPAASATRSAPSTGPTAASDASVTRAPQPLPRSAVPVLPRPPDVAPTLAPATFGSPHPFSLVAASPLRNWVVACQARRDTDKNGAVRVTSTPEGDVTGDDLQWFYLEAGSPDLAIDAFAGSDPQGRFVAYVHDGQMRLRDAQEHVDVALHGAELDDDAAPYRSHRAVAFAPDAPRVAYLRHADARQAVVLRELDTGTERSFELGPEPVWRLQLPAGGHFAQLATILVDSNKNRRLDWSFPKQKGPKRCPLPVPSYDVWSYPGDTSTAHLLDLHTGKISAPEGYVTTFGEEVLSRSSFGELWLDANMGGSKSPRRVASDKCLARVQSADSSRGVIVFGCAEQAGQRRTMYLHTAGRRVSLDMDLAGYETDSADNRLPQLLTFYPHNDTYLLDLDSSKLAKLAETTRVLGSFGNCALTEKNAQLAFTQMDGTAVKEIPLGRKRGALASVLQAAQFIALGPQLFDLKAREYVGSFRDTPLALSRDGLGLLPERAGDATRLPEGPVTWTQAAGS
jgi:hypothetical protein